MALLDNAIRPAAWTKWRRSPRLPWFINLIAKTGEQGSDMQVDAAWFAVVMLCLMCAVALYVAWH